MPIAIHGKAACSAGKKPLSRMSVWILRSNRDSSASRHARYSSAQRASSIRHATPDSSFQLIRICVVHRLSHFCRFLPFPGRTAWVEDRLPAPAQARPQRAVDPVAGRPARKKMSFSFEGHSPRDDLLRPDPPLRLGLAVPAENERAVLPEAGQAMQHIAAVGAAVEQDLTPAQTLRHGAERYAVTAAGQKRQHASARHGQHDGSFQPLPQQRLRLCKMQRTRRMRIFLHSPRPLCANRFSSAPVCGIL